MEKGTGAAPTDENMRCKIQGCSAAAKMHVKFSITDETKQEFSIENIEQVQVCSNHYHLLYKRSHESTLPCKTCGCKPKKCQAFNRHCPSPEIIEKYLRAKQGFSDVIHCDDVICLSCYKQHMDIIQTVKLFVPGECSDTTTPDSTDADLDALISQLEKTAEELQTESDTPEKQVRLAVLFSAIMVAKTVYCMGKNTGTK